jgi:hypothetical protein
VKYKALSAKKVQAICDEYLKSAVQSQTAMKRLETDDGQGVRWMMRDDHTREYYRDQFYREARYKLLELMLKP